MAVDCGCEARSARLRSLAASIRNLQETSRWKPADRQVLAAKLERLARATDDDWADDPGHLAQAIDAILDEAMEAFQAGESDQGVALVVGACVTVDQLLEAMNLPDVNEPAAGETPAQQMYGRPAAGEERAWDGSAAMSRCVKSSTPASCFSSICAGRRAGDAAKEATWALPHHDHAGGPANSAGVSAALGRIDQTQGLINKAAARAHLEAHQRSGQKSARRRPPRDDLYRGVWPVAFRDVLSNGAGWAPVMYGHFAVFDIWTRIDSLWEGEFMESIAPGAFTKTFQDNGDRLQVLFQHGRDFQIGSKVLGSIMDLGQDDVGARYEVELFDTSYNRDLLPPLQRGQYGVSFRFRVMKEEVTEEPGRSEFNPDGIPQRVILECDVMEFGPVTFPAYPEATANIRSRQVAHESVRSLSDFFIAQRLAADPVRLREMLGTGGERVDRGHDQDDDEHEHEGEPRQEEAPATSEPAVIVPVPPLDDWLRAHRAQRELGHLEVAHPD